MCLAYHFAHEHLGIENPMRVGNHPSCHREYGPEETEVEQHRSVRGDLEVEENVWVEDGGDCEHSCE